MMMIISIPMYLFSTQHCLFNNQQTQNNNKLSQPTKSILVVGQTRMLLWSTNNFFKRILLQWCLISKEKARKKYCTTKASYSMKEFSFSEGRCLDVDGWETKLRLAWRGRVWMRDRLLGSLCYCVGDVAIFNDDCLFEIWWTFTNSLNGFY